MSADEAAAVMKKNKKQIENLKNDEKTLQTILEAKEKNQEVSNVSCDQRDLSIIEEFSNNKLKIMHFCRKKQRFCK